MAYATADGSAGAPTDYTVSVNGDTSAEPDENFFVNLSTPVNVTITDSQGVGTILNDDLSYSIGGTIRRSDNNPLPNVSVALQGSQSANTTTDPNGRYAFTSLAANGSYRVTPSYQGIAFTPPTQSYPNLTGDVCNADFTATAADPTPTPSPTPSPSPSPTPTSSECCSLDQGVYGDSTAGFFHDGHLYNGFVMSNLVKALLGDLSFVQPLPPAGPYPQFLQVGVLGTRSLTIPLSASQCIITRLPATGSASVLHAGNAPGRLGDCRRH